MMDVQREYEMLVDLVAAGFNPHRFHFEPIIRRVGRSATQLVDDADRRRRDKELVNPALTERPIVEVHDCCDKT